MVKIVDIVSQQKQQAVAMYMDIVPEPLKGYLYEFRQGSDSIKFFNELDLETQEKLADHLLKITNIENLTTNFVNSRYANYLNQGKNPPNASSPEFVIKKFAEQELSSEVVQQMLQVELSNSFTSHPTSPLSRPLNELSIRYNRALQNMLKNPEAGAAEVKAVIEKMLAVDPNGEKKTQEDEVREALVYMENVVYGVVEAKKRIESALQKYPDYAHIKIGNFYGMNSWLCGDGDGNPNATAETLQMNVDLFRKAIREIYLNDLAAVKNSLEGTDLVGFINNIQAALEDLQYQNPQEFIEILQDIINQKDVEIPQNARAQINDLIYKVESFGFHYSKIEVRHNAGDLVETIADILSALGRVSVEKKQQLIAAAKNKQAQAEATKLLNEKFNSIHPSEFENIDTTNFSKTGKRVFERMQVVARAKKENPETFDKLIIAECEGEFHALCAFAVLQASGNSIQQQDSLDIVTLSESAEDLLALSKNIEALLDNKQYRQHISKLGRLIYMIAKSDTQRVGGIGAVYAQERVIEMVSQVFLEAQKKYPDELGNVGIMVFSGGGQAAPRGGGVISEVYNTVLKAVLRGALWSDEKVISFSQALEKLGSQPDPQAIRTILDEYEIDERLAQNIIKHLSPIFTTQGHQNIIWFADSRTAGITLENFFAQAAYANAKLNRHINEPEVLLANGQINNAAVKAREDREVYFQAAMADYTAKVFDPKTSGPIDELLENGPSKIMHLIINGSRPGKRPDSSKKSRAVDSRAISYDQVLTLAGLNFGNYVGALAGLKAVIAKNGDEGLDAAHSMYANDKATRDSMRSMAVSLAMTDFSRAWIELIGQEKPSMDRIKELAIITIESVNDDLNLRKQITLAKLEVEAIEVAKLAHQVITGQSQDLENFTPRDLLKEEWPDLAEQMAEREKKIAPISEILGRLIHDYNAVEDESEKKSLEKSIKLFASNILALSEMPASVTLTRTKHQSVESENEYEADAELSTVQEQSKPPAKIARMDTGVLRDMLSEICAFPTNGLTPRFAERVQEQQLAAAI